jgi:hypothetical protein
MKALEFSPSRPADERAREAFEDMRDDLDAAVRKAASSYVGPDEWNGIVDPVLLEESQELLTAVLRQSIESADDSDSRFPALALVEHSDPDLGAPESFPASGTRKAAGETGDAHHPASFLSTTSTTGCGTSPGTRHSTSRSRSRTSLQGSSGRSPTTFLTWGIGLLIFYSRGTRGRIAAGRYRKTPNHEPLP